MTASQPSLEILLCHQEWVRALARSLVADPSRADDVAQQTMLEAIQRPPRELSRPKAWLAKVAGNIARGFARQEGRRTRREQVVARDDVSHADPADAAQRAAMHKRVVDALFELPEPYHTVVLLRYFEDLDAREVAAQLDR
ncbi:MAG: RNA polymerase sigma factor (sigma-70 family), partial [Neolewinella sp.]